MCARRTTENVMSEARGDEQLPVFFTVLLLLMASANADLQATLGQLCLDAGRIPLASEGCVRVGESNLCDVSS